MNLMEKQTMKERIDYQPVIKAHLDELRANLKRHLDAIETLCKHMQETLNNVVTRYNDKSDD